jgi:hypothetical protein
VPQVTQGRNTQKMAFVLVEGETDLLIQVLILHSGQIGHGVLRLRLSGIFCVFHFWAFFVTEVKQKCLDYLLHIEI